MNSPALPEASSSRLAAKTRTVLAVIALLGVTLVFYYRLWLPGLVVLSRDAFRLTLPLKQYLVERLAAGELPQWFPYEAMGRPFIGVTHTAVFHPFTALYLLLPVPDAYRASVLVSCLLAALGAFALGRVLRLSPIGGMAAGITFSLSGYVVSLTENYIYLFSICMLPLFCTALEKALVERHAWMLAPAVIWATVFLIGDIQTGYYYLFIAVLWTAMRAPGFYRQAFVRLALIGGLAALLSGIQLGPAWAVFIGSDRTQPLWFHGPALIWSTHPLRLLTVLVSPLGQNANPYDMSKFFFGGPKWGGLWAESLYLGVPVTGLALLGAWHRRDLRLLALLGTLALVLALGRYGGLYEIFYHVVPLWSAFRFPEKLMGVVSFAVAMLAGAGLDALRAGKGGALPWLAVAVLCTGAGLLLQTEVAATWTMEGFGAPEVLARAVTGSATYAFLFSAVATLGVGLIAFGGQGKQFRERVLPLALAALVTFDLARVNFGAYHTGPIEAARFVPPLAEAIAAREGTLTPGRFRLISLRDSHVIIPPSLSRLLGQDAQLVENRQALGFDHNAEFHIETVYYYLPAIRAALPPKVGTDVAARFNVVYYIGRGAYLEDPRYVQGVVAALPDYDLVLFKNPVPAKPRTYLSRRSERADTPVDLPALFARPDFLSGEVDVIETAEERLPGPASDGVVAVERYTPEEVRVRVETPHPAVLVLLDAYDAGWSAMLENGGSIPILRANGLVRAVIVPAGNHMVTFSYQTPLLRQGAWISLVGTLLCTLPFLQARWRRRPAGPHQ